MVKILPREEQIENYKKFYIKAKRRIQAGETPESAYSDKPKGFTEWLKTNHDEGKGIKLPKRESIESYKCWKCGKVYTATKCPYCQAFKPKK